MTGTRKKPHNRPVGTRQPELIRYVKAVPGRIALKDFSNYTILMHIELLSRMGFPTGMREFRPDDCVKQARPGLMWMKMTTTKKLPKCRPVCPSGLKDPKESGR